MMFVVLSSKVPSTDILVAALASQGIADVRFTDEDAHPLSNTTLPSGISLAFRDLISTRPLLIERKPASISVRVQSGACGPTCALGAVLAAEFARHANTDVMLDDGSTHLPEALVARFDDAWADAHARSMLDGLVDFARKATDEGVRFAILRHEYRLTRPFLARLAPLPDLHGAIQAGMRRLNYLSVTDEDVYVPHIMEGTLTNGFRGKFTSYHGGRSLVRLDASVFIVPLDNAALDRDALLDVLGESVEWLSADYVILPTLDDAQMASLVADVARLVVTRPRVETKRSERDAEGPSGSLEDFVEEAIARGLETAMQPEVMAPIVLVFGKDGTRLLRLMADDMRGALRMLEQSIRVEGVDMYAFMFEGNIRGESTDALMIEAGERGALHSFQFAQVFDKAGQKRLGGPMLIERRRSRFAPPNVANIVAVGCLALAIAVCCVCGFSRILGGEAPHSQPAPPANAR